MPLSLSPSPSASLSLSLSQAQLHDENTYINETEPSPTTETRDRTQTGHQDVQNKMGGGEPEVEHSSIRQDSSPQAVAKPPIAAKPLTTAQTMQPTVQHRPQLLNVQTSGKRTRQRDVVTERIGQPTGTVKPRANSSPGVRTSTDLSSSSKSISPSTLGAEMAQGKKKVSPAGANKTQFPSSSANPRSYSATSSDLLQETDILSRLRELAKRNNYYGILHVGPNATQMELAHARRELTAQLHPDHFTGDPERQRWAQERLILVNQAFTDVLHNEANRQLYDQLCKFREVSKRMVLSRIIIFERMAFEVSSNSVSDLPAKCLEVKPFLLLSSVHISLRIFSFCRNITGSHFSSQRHSSQPRRN